MKLDSFRGLSGREYKKMFRYAQCNHHRGGILVPLRLVYLWIWRESVGTRFNVGLVLIRCCDCWRLSVVARSIRRHIRSQTFFGDMRLRQGWFPVCILVVPQSICLLEVRPFSSCTVVSYVCVGWTTTPVLRMTTSSRSLSFAPHSRLRMCPQKSFHRIFMTARVCWRETYGLRRNLAK